MECLCHPRHRSGNVLVLTLFLMVALMAMLAFAVDLGYLNIVRTELQRSADAAAIAATWRLIDTNAPTAATSHETLTSYAASNAANYAAANKSLKISPALGEGDLTIGYIANPAAENIVIDTASNQAPNAVRVRVRRDNTQNGEVPLFFARVLGFDASTSHAEATAIVLKNIKGFQASTNGTNLELLPYALDEDTWDDMVSGGGADAWRWNSSTEEVQPGSDGVREINLYPQGTGSPGNRGTVDIGSCNNSTSDIARQIVDGISPSDMEHVGGKLEFDSNGELELNGDTGISAGVKDELTSIIGDPRIIPIFRSVSGPGNNAQYVIVKFVGIRILDVQLTGKMSSKRVIIQPCNILVHGAIPSNSPVPTSQFVYSPAWLIR
jgi:Flp pilus assembly protein TadG